MEIPYGHCQCGCGQKTRLHNGTNKKRNQIKGEPRKFIHNHHCIGEKNFRWKGGKSKGGGGNYVRIRRWGKKDTYEHRLIAEKALGKPLPMGAEVHHANGIQDYNRNENLVICENKSYHQILEKRGIALKACGHADWRQCKYCHQWDDPKNLYVYPNGNAAFHRKCNAIAQAKIREKKQMRPSRLF